jgi:Fe-S oxidoreductase
MKYLLALMLALLLPLTAVAQLEKPMTETAKIEALIASVQHLPGAVFIRNGSEHDAVRAADHLRLKWKNVGKRVKTAEDFIRLCATGSSMSGKKYQIRFADGRTVDSAQYLHEQLRRIETGTAKPTVVRH